jgi:hypothetical protein
MIPIRFGGSGPDRANVRNPATITAPAAKIRRPEWTRPATIASRGSWVRPLALPPLWAPGTAMALSPGYLRRLLDEIVRRATAVSVAHHVQTLIAEPLDVDMWMGLPEQLISPRRTRTSGGDFTDPGEVREHYAEERPGIGAITDARALATMYAALLAYGLPMGCA